MAELVLVLFFLGMMALGVRRPFIWVLTYLYIDLVIPQKIGYAILPSMQISLVAFVAAFAGWALLDSKKGSRFTFRQLLITLLLVYCGYTTINADFPESAWTKWDWVWKSLLFGIFLPLTLRTKTRIETAALFIVLSIGAIAISGGIKTVLSGGGYGTLVSLVNTNSGIYESSTKSMAAIATIPLIVWCAKYNTFFPKHWAVWVFAAALIFACLLIPIGTQARTGLLCIGVLALLVLRHAKHRFLLGAMASFAVLASLPFLPAAYVERMSTIVTFQSDESASTRVAVWDWTFNYVKRNPMGGGFDSFLGNSFTYDTIEEVESGSVVTVETQEVTDEGRAFHSAYFELLGEQGWIGLSIWILIQLIGLIQTEIIQRRLRKSDDPTDQQFASLAVALQQGQIVFLVGALFVGIAYQPFVFVIVAMQIALSTIVARRRAEAREADRVVRRNAKREKARMMQALSAPLPAAE